MAVRYADDAGPAPWSIEDVPYHDLAQDMVRDDEHLFYIVASASFIEITSDLYTRNLVACYQGDREITNWLEEHWVKEELQHGQALKRYVQSAWPDFDWEGAYRTFLAEYGPLCTADQLASTRALEMAARCVVETGTAAFYRMLSDQCREPVLKQLAARISADEVRHYKYFYRYFRRYQALERPSRINVLRTLWRRAVEVDAEDAFCAFKAAFLTRNPGIPFERNQYRIYRDGIVQIARRHLPLGMAIKMLLRPLDLNAVVRRAVLPAMTSAVRLILWETSKANGTGR